MNIAWALCLFLQMSMSYLTVMCLIDFRRYQIFWEVVSLERDPLSLVSTIEELLERKKSGSGLENRDYDRRDLSRWPRGILFPQNLTLTSPTSGGRSIGIVGSWTQATEFLLKMLDHWKLQAMMLMTMMIGLEQFQRLLLVCTTSGDAQNNKEKSSRITKMKMFAILYKAKPGTGNIRGLTWRLSCVRPLRCLDCRCGMSY
jgi:hypothetical protein